MAEYVLHCFAQSGNAYKVALMLQLSGADWSPRWVDFFKGETRSPEYRAKNIMGEVPMLEHEGKLLTQSGVILDYLAEKLGKSGPSNYGPNNADERREILRWTLFDNHKLTSYIATYRYLLLFAKTGETPVTEFLKGRVNGALKVLDTHLAQQPFAIGSRATIADFSMCGYLFWPEEFAMTWAEYPNIAAWLERIKALPGWVHPYQLMPGHPLSAA